MKSLKWFAINIAVTIVRLAYLFLSVFKHMERIRMIAYMRSFSDSIIPASTQFDGLLTIIGTGHIQLGDYCRLGKGVELETTGNGRIKIGNNVRINTGSFIVAHDYLSIGNDALIGEYVSIRDSDHGIVAGQLIRSQKHKCTSIRIGNDVWIGRGSCILKGVTIGDGAVIGANSVITKNVPERTIFAGVPAKEIGKRGDK